ncbi:MAG: hypothetical protein ACK5XX_00285 [Holosporales bacterium]
MNQPKIWIHDEALRRSHPVFKVAPVAAKAVFVWDDDYFKESGYSLKRLVFIAEALSELGVTVVRGDTKDVFRSFAPSMLYIPVSANPLIRKRVEALKTIMPTTLVEDEPFAVINKPETIKRFFQYWKKAEKSVFLHNGGVRE